MAKHEIHSKIRGVTHDDPISGVNRQALIKAFVKPGMKLDLVPEPDNPVDPEAVAIHLRRRVLLVGGKEYHLGYLSQELAGEIRRRIARKERITVTVLNVTGGAEKTIGVNILISF